MSDWLEFEKECTQCLNDQFGHLATFRHLGSADSTVPDIHVTTKSNQEFYIDAKLTPAQCGQFVLLPDVATKRFIFSKKNKTQITPQVQSIIDHMNANFESYKEAGTKGKDIDLGDGGETFCQWIMSTYQQKGAEFFITNGYTILPISDFPKHFEVSATYRVKRSGSRAVSVNAAPQVIRHIENQGYPIQSHRIIDKKLFVYSSESLHNRRFYWNGSEYMFSKREDRYEIRVLSNTFNANVIFEITKKAHKGLTDADFVQYLMK